MRSDIFLRLPPPTALLLLFSIIDLTSAHAGYKLPRRTAAAAAAAVAADTLSDQYRALDISPYPPLPTSAPLHPSDLRRRQELNTVCGYIGGDPNLPATCSAGSHCVLEAAHGVIGCCPDGQDPCTTGIFTACVDANNPAQGAAAADPYAFTCGGGDVCYRNEFEGGFFQFGCGSASSMAATVFASASGISATLDRPSLTISFSETPSAKTVSDSSSSGSSSSGSSTASSTTSSSTRSTTSSTRSTSTHSSSSSSESKTSTVPTHTTAPTEKSTAAPPATANSSRAPDRTGAIVGGTISGVAVLIALIAAGIFLWRRRNRRRGNLRQGPGPGPKDVMTEYISPQMSGGGGSGAGAAAFQPLHQSYEAWETGLAPGQAVAYPAQAAPAPYPGSHSDAYAGSGAQTVGGRGVDGDRLHSDMVPLTREIDDFSRGFHDALGRIDEEDHTSTAGTEVNYGSGLNGTGMAGAGGEGDTPANGENGRPLWQQNRRLSRNMMWM